MKLEDSVFARRVGVGEDMDCSLEEDDWRNTPICTWEDRIMQERGFAIWRSVSAGAAISGFQNLEIGSPDENRVLVLGECLDDCK